MQLVKITALAGVLAWVSPSAQTQLASSVSTESASAKLWTPSEISTADYEASPSFSVDGREMIYLSADPGFRKYRLLSVKCENGQWSKPEAPAFAALPPVIEADASFTPDGKGVYFVSARHDPTGENFDIWFAGRLDNGGWGQPVRLPEPVNSSSSELLPRIDRSGRLFFGSARSGGHGQSDIYVATRDRTGKWTVNNVGAPISTSANEYEADISLDGKTMVVVADRGDRSHLYHFRWRDREWHEVGKIPARSDVFQVGPLISPKGEKLLFAQSWNGKSGEIFLIDLVPGSTEAWPPRCVTARP